MIISASYRTDIPAFYGRWFLRRLEAGFCQVANPYSQKISRIDLSPASAQGFVFWSKNAAPFLPALAAVHSRQQPFVVLHGLCAYPRALERAVAAPDVALATMRTIRATYGPQVVVWRYDPIVLTSLTPAGWHRENFARLARRLQGITDEVIVSFVEVYRKTRAHLDAVARTGALRWWEPSVDEQQALVLDLAGIAAEAGICLRVCCQPHLGALPGVTPARCVDAARLSAVAGTLVRAPARANRPGCGCAESRDIGAYDTCPHGCAYCYAVSDPSRARQHRRHHDPDSPALTVLPPEPPAHGPQQLSLF